MKNVKKIIAFMIALMMYGAFFNYVLTKNVGRDLDFSAYAAFGGVIFRGWMTTVLISLLSVVLALFVGLLLYLMEQTNFSVLHYLAVIHKNIIFGTPLLVIAIVSYYYVGNAFSIQSKIWVGTITLGFYIGAYISDIYKGAIESIHINQWQTAKMFGFTKYQTYRYIVFPQVVMSILPPLAGQFALTIKGSALLSYMGTAEYFNQVNAIIANTLRSAEGFVLLAVGYLLLTVPLIKLVRYLEIKLNYKV